MINLILLFPLLACLILFIFKKDYLNNLMLNLYAGLHFLVSTLACCGIVLFPNWTTCSFFQINNRNILFLMVMSIVFLAVAIYNNGYLKNEEVDAKKMEAINNKRSYWS